MWTTLWGMISIVLVLLIVAVLGLIFAARKEKPADETFMTYYEDGLFDLFFGLGLILYGIVIEVLPSLVGITFVLLYPILLALKQAITKPRVRPEEVTPATVRSRNMAMFAVLGLVFLLGLVFFELSFWDRPPWLIDWLRQNTPMTITALAALVFVIWGYKSGVTRLYAYAALFVITYLVSQWITLTLPIYLIVLGSGITLTGLWVTAQFVRSHPKRNEAMFMRH